MKAQTQAVTAVTILGIMVGTIAAIYVWGTPLLEKREAQAELSQAENDVVSLMNGIESAAAGGEGSSSEVDLRLNDGEVTVNEDDNYIEVSTLTESSDYPMGTWTLIEGNSIQGLSIGEGDYAIQGQDSSGVVAVQANDIGDSERVDYRIEFRNMMDDDIFEVEKIDLDVAGSPQVTGDPTVQVTNQGDILDTFEIGTGEEFDRERTEIRVTLS